MAELAKDWFGSYVPAPRGPDTLLEDYVYSPPRGMTCAPQNPKVRAKLLQDLADYGIPLENPSYPASLWPPQVHKDKPPPEQHLGALSRASPKNRHTMISTNSAIATLYSGSVASRPARKRQLLWSGRHNGTDQYDYGQDISYTVAGRPTALWRPNKISLESSTSVPVLKSPEKELLDTFSKEGKKKEKDKKQLQGSLSESELRNARDVLKGQQSLHIATVQERFKFTADTSPGVPAHAWDSEASFLLNFHSGAIRKVAPSGLEPVKEPPKWKRKKKKKDDIEDLQLSESGIFVQKYPIDESLKSLRRLKKNMYPEVVRRQQEEAAAAAAALAQADERHRASLANFVKSATITKKEPSPLV